MRETASYELAGSQIDGWMEHVGDMNNQVELITLGGVVWGGWREREGYGRKRYE